MIPEDLPWSLHRTATSKIIITIEIMFDETSIRNNGVAVNSLSARKRILSIHYTYIISFTRLDIKHQNVSLQNLIRCHFC